MSRHRDVRSMNYSDEYDGYDDVYGHSMEDDYCVSPSVEQFLFDRSKQQNIASFITEPDIVEDNEDIDDPLPVSNESRKYNFSELERTKLMSCLETIRNVIGDTVPDSKLKEKIILSNFDANVALDAILKESSPKNISDSMANKEQLERYPGVLVDKSNTSMFTIPKFSFNKQHNLFKDSTLIMHQPSNINNSKDVKHSRKTFSSLAELISHHTESINLETKISSQNDANEQSSNSLAALTAHLQKSNIINNNNNIESEERYQPSISQFVIPKLPIKENDNEKRNIQLPKFYNSKNSKRQLISTNILSKNEIDLLQKDFSNMDITIPESNMRNINSEKRFKDSINVVNDISTLSSDDWIDLSTALKEAEFLTVNAFSKTNLTTSEKYYDMHNLEICIEDDRVIPNMLPVTLNLCALRNVKLPCIKKNVSVFGRTLCRKWKIKRPVLKVIVQHYNTVKPFDFSIPYQYSNRQ